MGHVEGGERTATDRFKAVVSNAASGQVEGGEWAARNLFQSAVRNVAVGKVEGGERAATDLFQATIRDTPAARCFEARDWVALDGCRASICQVVAVGNVKFRHVGTTGQQFREFVVADCAFAHGELLQTPDALSQAPHC